MPKLQHTLRTGAVAATVAVTLGPLSSMADTWEIVVPPNMPRGDDLNAEVWDFFLHGLKPGDRLTIYDGFHPRERLRIAVPDEASFEDPRLRTKALARETARLGREIASLSDAANPEAPYRIRFPEFAYEYSQTRSGTEAELLVITSGIHVSDLEPSFSFRLHDGTLFLPTDGHIEAPLSLSPYGTEGREATLEGVGVHFCVLSDEFRLTTYQRDELRRFWSLYVEWLGGELATFTESLSACFARWRDKARGMPREELDISDGILAMRAVTRTPIEDDTGTGPGGLPGGVEQFSLFSSKPHPGLLGIEVITGIKYRSDGYPLSYERAWCYVIVENNGAAIQVHIGVKLPHAEIAWANAPRGTLDAAGIRDEDVQAARGACQFPPDAA